MKKTKGNSFFLPNNQRIAFPCLLSLYALGGVGMGTGTGMGTGQVRVKTDSWLVWKQEGGDMKTQNWFLENLEKVQKTFDYRLENILLEVGEDRRAHV